MNTYNINDDEFKKTDTYKEFMSNNPEVGNLRIRAYAASGAVPISGLKVVISKNIDDYNVIFFEGFTNESGVIEKIKLPTPLLNNDNLLVPNYTEYDLTATYMPDNINLLYKINMYEGVCVIQTINIVPKMNRNMGDNNVG